MESVILTAVIDYHKEREVVIVDIPNKFIQTDNTKNVGDQRDMMKIRGKLANILVDISPEFYGPYITYENGKELLYLELLKALYGILIVSLILYKNSSKDLKAICSKVNPYDPCVANNMIRNKQRTMT